jgi:hypothetical protein
MRYVKGAITLVANSWQGSAEVAAPHRMATGA